MANQLNIIQNEKPWFSEGLRFHCTGCGKCCTGSPGYVWVTPDEIIEMASFLQLSIDEFSRRYIRKVDDRYSLREHPQTFACVFLKDSKCQLYEARPKQCRTFPWWQQNLTSKQQWLEAAAFCEGINHKDAPLVPYDTIAENANM